MTLGVFLCNELCLHWRRVFTEYYTIKLVLLWFTLDIQISPQHTEVRTIFLIDLYLQVHFPDVTSKSYRIAAKPDQEVEEVILQFRTRKDSIIERTFADSLSILTIGKWGRYHVAGISLFSRWTSRRYPLLK